MENWNSPTSHSNAKSFSSKFHSIVAQSSHILNTTASKTPARRQLFLSSNVSKSAVLSGQLATHYSSSLSRSLSKLSPAPRITDAPVTPSLYDIVQELTRQQETKKVQNQLPKIYQVLLLLLWTRHHKVEKSMAKSKSQLDAMTQKIELQQGEICTLKCQLDAEVQRQQDECSQLSLSLQSQREALSKALAEGRVEMERQCYIIDEQQKVLQKLMKEKSKHDLVVDSMLLLISWSLNSSVLLDYPLELSLPYIPWKQFRTWIKELARVLFIAKMFMTLKQLSRDEGVYGSHDSHGGSVQGYFQQVIKRCIEYLTASYLV